MKSIYILQIDTSTTVCSVALSRDGKTIGLSEIDEPNMHATRLTQLISGLMEEHRLCYQDLSAVAVAKGPGSYTGLRIGVSTAKGLCYAADVPMIAIDSLQSMAAGFLTANAGRISQANPLKPELLCPMIDARRMEVYRAVFTNKLRPVRSTEAAIISEDSFDFLSEGQAVCLFGNGADKLQEFFLHHPLVSVIPGFQSTAAAMSSIAYALYLKSEFVDLVYFEPFYLKDFIPTTPKRII